MMLSFRHGLLVASLVIEGGGTAGALKQTSTQQDSATDFVANLAGLQTDQAVETIPQATDTNNKPSAPQHVAIDDIGAPYVLRQRSSMQRLDIQGSNAWRLAAASSSLSQRFHLVASTAGSYLLGNDRYARCLQTAGGGTTLQAGDCTASDEQRW